MATGTIPNPPTREEFNNLNDNVNRAPGIWFATIANNASVMHNVTFAIVFKYDANSVMFSQLIASRGSWTLFNASAEVMGNGITWADDGTFTNRSGVTLSVMFVRTGSVN